nr:helix-hairpin-helix domain-containing protein [Kribbella solani]
MTNPTQPPNSTQPANPAQITNPTQPANASTQQQPNQPANPSTQQPTPGTTSQPQVVVHVAGKVRHPGLIRAPAGSRVADVLALAGGPLPAVDLTTLNLARPVTDGEQIIVGQPNQPPPPTPPTTAPGVPTPASTANTTVINLNTATLDQLDALPGVGPVLAQRILDYRTQNGPFTTIDQLQDIPGVGPKKFTTLKPHVRL